MMAHDQQTNNEAIVTDFWMQRKQKAKPRMTRQTNSRIMRRDNEKKVQLTKQTGNGSSLDINSHYMNGP